MTDDRDTLRAWLHLLGTANAIKKGVDTRLRQRFGTSISRFDVLAALDRADDEGLTAGGLTAYLKVTEGNTTQVTAPLIQTGLVQRTVSPRDGRVAIFRLTTKGRQLFAAMAEENRRWIDDAFSRLAPTEIAQLRTLLAAIEPPSIGPEPVPQGPTPPSSTPAKAGVQGGRSQHPVTPGPRLSPGYRQI
ncbi:MarR family winged helix-turn-helix transcriptional regulator [Sphingomonas cavernae]|uniref:MarR family transcriptional regulator n=1 Tax=Sphingomonas cavernae TaxID=2320861 RepID=A0A418W7G6_9SPHN|nr:MarR family transcriptional regulator [Sphingomonas cavernae]RJF85947.1 MarR family transcriptional regulator [Sphingomonas cavernae]